MPHLPDKGTNVGDDRAEDNHVGEEPHAKEFRRIPDERVVAMG